MKRMLPLCVSAALLLCGCAVKGKEEAPLPTFPVSPAPVTAVSTEVPLATSAPLDDPAACWTAMDPTAPMQMDLNGDGADETVTVAVDEGAYVSHVTIVSGNAVLTDRLDTALSFLKAYYGDARLEDGSKELYLTGDEASNDYATYIYRIADGKLERAEIYGEAVACDGSALTIQRAADVLGTYESSCQYTLRDGFTFERTSPFRIMRYEGDWKDRVLTLQKDGLPVQTDAGETTLKKGAELMLVETDQETYALLEDRQGAQYRISIEKPAEDWRWFIGGIAEEEWFGTLLYAG